MKKLLIAFMSAVSIVCLGLAAACVSEPTYYTLTYVEQEGITYDFGEIQNGAEVREGYEVTFTVTKDESLSGEVTVMANENAIESNEDGSYSFVMTQNTEITVGGVWTANKYNVLFDSGNEAGGQSRIWYYDLDGNEITNLGNLSYTSGESVSFRLKVSVYYGDSDYTVTANTLVLKPDEDGVYSFQPFANTTVSVNGLEEDDSFIARENGGKGTKENPFIIEKPIDLYAMADLVGDSFHSGRYALSYYRMEADIDLQGEQLFVIGDRPTDDSISMFCGDFDGNGHTISNYYIADSIIEQSSYTEVPLRYLGLFGFATATLEGEVNIYDLTLENFEMEVNGSKYQTSGFYAGGLVGYGVGVNISNVKVNGKITADGNTDYFSNVGGIIGYQQAVYASDNTKYNSAVVSSVSDVEIECAIGNVYTLGGISGLLVSGNYDANAYILNSASLGSVSGGIYTGGIVGYASAYSAVVNCYAAGDDVYARSEVGLLNGRPDYAYAYAGGIVGFADGDTLIANCLAYGLADAYSTLGSRYQFAGKIAGGFEEEGSAHVDVKEIVLLNNKHIDEVSNINADFFKNTLGWKDADWTFGDGNPVPKSGNNSVNYKVTVKYLGGNTVSGADQAQYTVNMYQPVSYWYGGVIPEFVTSDSDGRSYGYFFDEAKTIAVPAAFIPTGDITIYADFADYSRVSGTYYLPTEDNAEAYLKLNADGTFLYRYGALSFSSYYTFDGAKILLQPCPLFTETSTSDNGTNVYNICAMAVVGSNTVNLSFTDNVNFTANSPLLAVKYIDGFNYGEYYATNGNADLPDYVFYKNGEGVRGNTAFNYTVNVDSGEITLYLGLGGTLTGTITGGDIVIDNVTYRAYDEFKGVWEKSATTHKKYAIDGKGGWSYESYKFGENGAKVTDTTARGTYTIADGVLTLSENNTKISFNSEGFLNVDFGNYTEVYYKENSFVGEWKFFNVSEPITITLEGVGASGYGEAYVAYGSGTTSFNMNYEIADNGGTPSLVFYYGDVVYGELIFSADNGTLTGAFYSVYNAVIRDDVLFCLTDDLQGVWVSNELGTVEFNGLGSYSLTGNSVYTRVAGSVKINGRTVGAYKLENGTMSGSFTYNGVKYLISFNEQTKTINVKPVDEEENVTGEFELKEIDELVSIVLTDGERTYTFNGGGRLPAGGILTVSGDESVYTYFIGSESITVKKNGEEYGTIVLSNGVYTLTAEGGSKELTVSNVFTGEWVKGGVNGGAVVIGKINGALKAEGTYLGEQVVYTYNIEGNYLSFNYKNETLYLLSMKANSGYELAVSSRPGTGAGFEVCMKAENRDSLLGTYAAADGSVIELDGFLSSLYTKGTAVRKNGDGEFIASYTYTYNSLHEIQFRNNDKILVFIECESGAEGAYVKGENSYLLVEPDELYLRSSTDSAGLVYTFNGRGKVTVTNGMVFDYVIVSYDEIRYKYNLTFSDGTNEYEAVYNRNAATGITVTPDYMKGVNATDASGVRYVFDGEGKVTLSDERSYQYVISAYNIVDKKYTLTLTDANNAEYLAVYSVESGVITVTPVENEQ